MRWRRALIPQCGIVTSSRLPLYSPKNRSTLKNFKPAGTDICSRVSPFDRGNTISAEYDPKTAL
jgi:hypothetical protein